MRGYPDLFLKTNDYSMLAVRTRTDTDLGAAKPLAGRYHLLRKGARDYGLVRIGQ